MSLLQHPCFAAIRLFSSHWLSLSIFRQPVAAQFCQRLSWTPASEQGLTSYMASTYHLLLSTFGSEFHVSTSLFLPAMSTTFDCERLADDWDQTESVRLRLRETKPLCVKVGSKQLPDSSVAECAANSDLLTPACMRLFASRGKLPDIQSLRDTVLDVYKKSSRQIHDEEIDDMAWEVRKMLRLIKRKAGRSEVSQASWSQAFFRSF